MADLDVPPTPTLIATLARARVTPKDPGELSIGMLSHGSLDVRWYAPATRDPQVPHDRNELYIIVSGTGRFLRSLGAGPFEDWASEPSRDERVSFGPGDALFVPAGSVHRFEEFSDDFAAWAIFYGPEGGE